MELSIDWARAHGASATNDRKTTEAVAAIQLLLCVREVLRNAVKMPAYE